MDAPLVKPIIFEVPGLTPPSVNHYKVPWWNHRTQRIEYKITAEAIAFMEAVAIFARGQSLAPKTPAERRKIRYALVVTVFLGKGEHGDGDNYWKCVGDALEDARVIHSDGRVRSWHLEVDDGDRENPRTLICVSLDEGGPTMAEVTRDYFSGEKGS